MKFLTLMVLASVILSGCHWNESGVRKIGVDPRISDCGGFSGAQNGLSRQMEGETLCSDERLIWQYDPDSRNLSILNSDVWLNCCGKHRITALVSRDTGIYTIEETDKPEAGDARCGCMCCFDFGIDLPDTRREVIRVQIYRHVTDGDPRSLVWEGDLDLAHGEGEVVITENVGWCDS